MTPVGDLATLLVSTALLWVGARVLVTGAARLAGAAGVSSLVIGLTVVAFGTSAPEFAVTLEAALGGRPAVSVGNVVGSNVFNLGVILGAVAVIRPFRVSESLVRRDAVAMGAATLIALAALWNLAVSTLEGLVLTGLLLAYVGGLFVDARRSSGADTGTGEPASETETDAGEFCSASWLDVLRVLVGVGLVVVGGHLLVDSATTLARRGGLSEWTIGVTIVAAGTSLPELATSLVAARRGEVAIAAGNVIGSNVFNLLGVLGVAALVHPLAVGSEAIAGFAWLVVLTAVTAVLLATGRRLTRLEGGALIGLVAVYWVTSVVV
ncbi:calcium/sodium antiporter [Natrononativus amylolyticus]|uniref:calcium/sodium antiporter n=1 Tax=Natrononativus amylolyticus TaxID=2963434 RepID=UPI0020CE32C7|nr:calcium/sodium antiporter [Natrononativus amylolyticus]